MTPNEKREVIREVLEEMQFAVDIACRSLGPLMPALNAVLVERLKQLEDKPEPKCSKEFAKAMEHADINEEAGEITIRTSWLTSHTEE